MSLLSELRIESPHVGGGPVTSMDVDNESESRFLLCGGADCTVSVHDLSRPSNRDVRVVRPSNRSRRAERDDLNDGDVEGHRCSVSAVRWWPVDTGMFVSTDLGGRVCAWDAERFEVAASFRYGTDDRGDGRRSSGSIRCAALPRSSASVHLLLALGDAEDPRVRLCDVGGGGGASHVLFGHAGGGVRAVAWSPRNNFLLATGGDDGTVRLWDVRRSGSRACLGALDREAGGRCVAAAVVAPNDRSRGRRDAGVRSHGGPVLAAAFAPDGRRLVSAGADGLVRTWDLEEREALPVRHLSRANGEAPFGGGRAVLALSRPTSRSATTLWIGGRDDGTISGWRDADRGGPPDVTLEGHLGAVTCAAEQERDGRLLTGSEDGMVLAWGRSSRGGRGGDDGAEDEDRW